MALVGALGFEIAGHWGLGLRPDASGYAALVYLASVLQLQIVGAIVVMACVVSRASLRPPHERRRVTFEAFAC